MLLKRLHFAVVLGVPETHGVVCAVDGHGVAPARRKKPAIGTVRHVRGGTLVTRKRGDRDTGFHVVDREYGRTIFPGSVPMHDGEARSVRTHGHSFDVLLVVWKDLPEVVRRNIPEFHGTIPVAGDQRGPFGIERKRANGMILKWEGAKFCFSHEVPELEVLAEAAGGEEMTVRMKRDACHGTGMPWTKMVQCSCGHVPDPYLSV